MIVITGLLIAHLNKSHRPGDNEDRDRVRKVVQTLGQLVITRSETTHCVSQILI